MASVQPKSVQSPEYIALKSFLSGDIKVLGNALNTFCTPVESKCLEQSNVSDSDSVESLLWISWTAVVITAGEVHYTSPGREKLVDFMINLAYRPTPLKEGEGCVVSGMTVWRELPIFGWELRDSWNFDPSQNTSKNEQWINLNAWTSTFMAVLHTDGIDWLDYTLFGLWSIRSGLEEDNTPPHVLVEAAAVWFVYSGSALWNLCKQNKSYDGKVAAPGSIFKDQAWNGFSVERWNSWAQRLLDLQNSSPSSQTTVQLVTQAREAMKAAQVDQKK